VIRDEERGIEGKGGDWGHSWGGGVVWDREGEEGMRVIQRKGMGWEGKGKKGREGREEEDDLAPQKIPGSATAG
jgi:hypothetical protein